MMRMPASAQEENQPVRSAAAATLSLVREPPAAEEKRGRAAGSRGCPGPDPVRRQVRPVPDGRWLAVTEDGAPALRGWLSRSGRKPPAWLVFGSREAIR